MSIELNTETPHIHSGAAMDKKTVGAFILEWMNDYKRPQVASRTVKPQNNRTVK